MRFPFVILPRSVYDDMRDEKKTLVQLLASLKKEGFTGRVTREAAMHLPEPEPEERAIEEAEVMAKRAMVADFMRNGLSQGAAEKEAGRIAVAFNQSHPQQLY